MVTETDVIQQVAEVRCPNLTQCEDGSWACFWTADNTLATECPICQGTGLRWPPLSRECHGLYGDWAGDVCHGRGCNHCNHTGRVPDVTLEKVLPMIYCVRKWGGGPKWVAYAGHDDIDGPVCNTPLEAACAALLAT